MHISMRTWRRLQVRAFGWSVTLFLGWYGLGAAWRRGEIVLSLGVLFVHMIDTGRPR